MSKKHPGTWTMPPGKEDIRPVERTTDLKKCVTCGRVSGNKSRYMDNALGQRISISVCGNTCFANYLEKQARLALQAQQAITLDTSYASDAIPDGAMP